MTFACSPNEEKTGGSRLGVRANLLKNAETWTLDHDSLNRPLWRGRGGGLAEFLQGAFPGRGPTDPAREEWDSTSCRGRHVRCDKKRAKFEATQDAIRTIATLTFNPDAALPETEAEAVKGLGLLDFVFQTAASQAALSDEAREARTDTKTIESRAKTDPVLAKKLAAGKLAHLREYSCGDHGTNDLELCLEFYLPHLVPWESASDEFQLAIRLLDIEEEDEKRWTRVNLCALSPGSCKEMMNGFSALEGAVDWSQKRILDLRIDTDVGVEPIRRWDGFNRFGKALRGIVANNADVIGIDLFEVPAHVPVPEDDFGAGVVIPLLARFREPLGAAADCNCHAAPASLPRLCRQGCFSSDRIESFSFSAGVKQVDLTVGLIPKDPPRSLFHDALPSAVLGGYLNPVHLPDGTSLVRNFDVEGRLGHRGSESGYWISNLSLNVDDGFDGDLAEWYFGDDANHAQEEFQVLLADEFARGLAPLIEPWFNYKLEQSPACGAQDMGCVFQEMFPAVLTNQVLHWFHDPLGPLSYTHKQGGVTEERTDAMPDVPYYHGVSRISSTTDTITFELTHDIDGDGLSWPEDLCPYNFDRDNANRDHDALGDLCDPCPDFAGPAPHYGDFDRDGVCDNLDNCFGVYNPRNRNTNLISEEVSKSKLYWGDECDPVPTPAFDVRETVEERGCDGASPGFCTSSRRVERTDLDIRPLGSHQPPAPKPAPAREDNSVVPVDSVPLEFRFCQDQLEAVPPIKCGDPKNIDDDLAYRAPTLALEKKEDAWHRVTLLRPEWRKDAMKKDQYRLAPGFTHTTQMANRSFNEGESQGSRPRGFRWEWDWEADYTRWRDAGMMVNLPAPPVGGLFPTLSFEPLKGRFWIHADTKAGSAPEFDVGTGVHDKELSNAYQDLIPFSLTNGVHGPVATDLRRIYLRRIFDILDLVDPQYRTELSVFAAGQQLVVLQAARGRLAPRIAGDVVSPRLTDLLRGSLGDVVAVGSWESVRGTESSVASNSLEAATPSALILSADGTSILDGVVLQGGQALAWSELREVAAVAVGVRADAPVGLEEGGSSSVLGRGLPEPRQGFVPLYAPRENRLFLVGGEAADGLPAGDVWFGRPGSDLSRLTAPGALGTVLAAAHAPQREALFVVDETRTYGRQSHKERRLLRVDTTTGEVDVLIALPAIGKSRLRDLVIEPDGTLLLAFSDERAGLHALLRLDAEDGVPLGFLLGEGALAGALVPGPEGARRLIREADGTVRVDDVAEGPGELAGPLWGLALAMRTWL